MQVILELLCIVSKITSYLCLVNVGFGCNMLLSVVTLYLAKGSGVDSQKIEAVKRWPIPTSATDIRSFLGLVGYHKNLMKEFLDIASPLTRLTQKIVKFE